MAQCQDVFLLLQRNVAVQMPEDGGAGNAFKEGVNHSLDRSSSAVAVVDTSKGKEKVVNIDMQLCPIRYADRRDTESKESEWDDKRRADVRVLGSPCASSSMTLCVTVRVQRNLMRVSEK